MRLLQRAFLTLAILSIYCSAIELQAAEPENPPAESTFDFIKSRIRMRTFTEFMTPGFQDNPSSVPHSNGSQLLPTNTFNIAWIDYKIAENYYILYWQRAVLTLASIGQQGMNITPRNPRFALRRTQIFNVPNLSTTYDFYIQPGLAPEATTAGRKLEVGFRTSTAYSFPSSKWSIGMVTEFTTAYSAGTQEGGADVYGWLMPWVNYSFSSVLSAQLYLPYNFQHIRRNAWYDFELDTPHPYSQAGLGVNFSDSVSASFLLNTYLNVTPTLKTSWASVWLSIAFM